MKDTNQSPRPIAQFKEWFQRANDTEVEPTAFCLATDGLHWNKSDPRGQPDSVCHFPDARMLLAKAWTGAGELLFFSSEHGDKAFQITRNSQAAVCFFWPVMGRQVRMRGQITRLSEGVVQAFWKDRGLLSRFVSWVSVQSARWPEEKRMAEHVIFALRSAPWKKAPPWWAGFSFRADVIEFLELKPARASRRTRYTRWLAWDPSSNLWNAERLMP